MIDEVLPGVFRLEIPLPRNPLKALNSFVIKAPGRNLIIDTGMNREECRTAMEAGLRELEVDLSETDFFITHMHADHAGLIGSLATPSSRVYASEPDGRLIKYGSNWEENGRAACRNGFPEDEVRAAIDRHPAHRYGPAARGLDLTIVGDGDPIAIGDYSFRCLFTPGHTPGHICLYEPHKRFLVAGDLILIDITPNISMWHGQTNVLQQYLDDLDRVYQLDVDLVLPGHRRLITDCKARIRELKHHHRVRADEVISILQEGPKNAYQVAAGMTWDMKYDSFADFPVQQKWFAGGEALAHLRFLEGEGSIEKDGVEPVIRWRLRGTA